MPEGEQVLGNDPADAQPVDGEAVFVAVDILVVDVYDGLCRLKLRHVHAVFRRVAEDDAGEGEAAAYLDDARLLRALAHGLEHEQGIAQLLGAALHRADGLHKKEVGERRHDGDERLAFPVALRAQKLPAHIAQLVAGVHDLAAGLLGKAAAAVEYHGDRRRGDTGFGRNVPYRHFAAFQRLTSPAAYPAIILLYYINRLHTAFATGDILFLFPRRACCRRRCRSRSPVRRARPCRV